MKRIQQYIFVKWVLPMVMLSILVVKPVQAEVDLTSVDADCYSATYASGNLVTAPSFSGDFSTLTQLNKGWTNFDPKSTEDACDDASGSIYLKGGCYPNGGVIDFQSGTAILPSTAYRIVAQVKNETAATGAFNFVLPNAEWDLEDTDNHTTDQYLVNIPKTTGWERFDKVVTSGAGATGNVKFLFMSCDGHVGSLNSDEIYLDHLEVYEVPNTEAGAYGISFTSGSLNETFDINTLSYTATLPSGTTEVTPTVTTIDPGATVSGNGAVDVSSGSGTSTLVVLARDGSTSKTYTVNYTVLQVSNDADLSGINISAGSLMPAFDKATTSYEVFVPNGTSSVNINATRSDSKATFTINGTTATDGVDQSITLTDGSATATIEITAEDLSTKTYTVSIQEICFSSAYSSGNLFSNPSFIGDMASITQFDKGWTNFDPKSSEDACGDGSGSLHIKGGCYPDGGVLTFNSGTPIVAGHSYRIKAQIKNETASLEDFNFVLPNSVWGLEDNDGAGTNQYLINIPSTTGWETFDVIVTAGAAATGNLQMLFMSCDGLGSSTNSDVIYLDNFEVYEITSSMDVVTDGNLKVYGGVTVNNIDASNGSVTLESGVSLAIMGTATGNATIKRNTTADGGYSIVGAPVSGADLSDLNADWLYSWDGSMYNAETSGAMTPGMGYFAGYAAASNEVSLSGALVSGNQSVSVSAAGDGFNLVANPYAAAISVSSFLAANADIDDAVYFWNDGGVNNGSDRAGDYVTVNELGSVGSVDLGDGVAGLNTTAANTDIGTMQGFYVHSAAGGTVSFTPAMQTGGSNADDNFYRMATEQSTLKLALSGAHYNEVLFGFRADATTGVDGSLDALKKIGNEKFAFYSMIGTEKYAIQGLPELNGETSISLGYEVKEAGTYELSIKSIDGIADEYRVVAHFNGNVYDITNGAASLNLPEGSGTIELRLTTSAILSTEANKAFVVYGSEGVLNINLVKSVNQANIQIMDMSGRTIELMNNQSFENGKWSKEVNLQSNRIYILKVQTSEGVFTQKFIY